MEIPFEQPCHDRYITENFAGCHDPVAEYVEKPRSGNGWLCDYSKEKVFYHNLLPFSSSFLIWIKHGEETQSSDQLLDWPHCNS